MDTEYITLIIYMILLLTLGAYFARFNRNLSDFIRGGAQGTWWIVGMSMFISGISAFTYTGAASAAFQAGPSLFAMYFANVASFVVSGLFLAKWFRQTRALTVADIIRERFGVAMEQFNAYAGVVMNPISGGIQMYRNYKGAFRRSSPAIWASYHPLSCWGARLYAAPLLSSAGRPTPCR